MRKNLVLNGFINRNGVKVILRTPSYDDLEDLMTLINSLVEEKAKIACTEKVTLEQEREWLIRHLEALEQNSVFSIVADVGGKVVASSDIHIQAQNKEVGIVGIIVKKGFRNLGIGTQMLKLIINQASLLGIKCLRLSVLGTNGPAISTYAKIGFKRTRTIHREYFRDGQYIDKIIMERSLNANNSILGNV